MVRLCGPSLWSVLCPLIGAIAQLGERLLCKQEVVGSIPSGSTRRRRCKSKLQINLRFQNSFVREFQSATLGFSSSAGVMSDIVKRRSIRAFGAAVKGRGRRAISNQESELRNQ